MHKMNIVMYCILFPLLCCIYVSCKDKKTDSFDYYKKERSKNKVTVSKQSSYVDNLEKIKITLGKKELEVSLGYEIKKQKVDSRKWVKIELINDFKIGGIVDTTFAFPTQIRTDTSGNIYVLDMSAKCVKQFDPKGKFIRRYGREGKGPGEFQSPSRMDVLPNGKIIVLDPNLNKCAIFDGDKMYQVLCHLQPIGVCFNNGTEFSTLQLLNPLDYAPIRKYNFSGEKTKDYQNLLLTKSFGDVVVGALPFLAGDLYGMRGGELIFIPRYMNHIVKFSINGSIQYSRNTIDDIDLPSFKREKFNIVSFRFPEEQISAYRSAMAEDKIYIVNKKTTNKTKNRIKYVIDCYSTKNGDYLYSFTLTLDEQMGNIHMTRSKIYLLQRNTKLSVFSYKIVERSDE